MVVKIHKEMRVYCYLRVETLNDDLSEWMLQFLMFVQSQLKLDEIYIVHRNKST